MSSESPFANRVRVRSCALITRGPELLLVRQKTPTRPHPVWLPPGGGVQMGEQARDAVRREVKEESGLQIVPGELAAIHEFVEPPFHALELYFWVSEVSGELRLGQDPELSELEQQIIDCAFINPNDLGEDELYPGFLNTFETEAGPNQFKPNNHFITK